MGNAVRAVVIVLAVILLVVLSTSVFLGAGYILSLILPLGLFQSSLLSIGATFLVAFSIAAIVVCTLLTRLINQLVDQGGLEDRWEDEEDEEDERYGDGDEDGDDDESDERLEKPFVRRIRVPRNAPCPCGSGSKYKNCCGK